MIGGTLYKKEDILKISIAGPITNFLYAIVFLALGFALAPVSFGYAGVMFFSAYINAFMAVFNLIPFGVLDGFKIFSVNKTTWAAIFVPSVILTIVTFLLF
jgi:Zn-dependent protease